MAFLDGNKQSQKVWEGEGLLARVGFLEWRSACDINEGPDSDEGATDGVGGEPLMAVAAS
jgi:hypothetical protein